MGGPFYQVLLAGAAIRAVWREQRGRNDWELTSHVGAHLTRAENRPEDRAETRADAHAEAGSNRDIREDVPA